MRRALVSVWCGFLLLAINAAAAEAPPAGKVSASTAIAYDESGFYSGEAGLTPSQRAGREIWYKAAAGEMCGSRPLAEAVTKSTGIGS